MPLFKDPFQKGKNEQGTSNLDKISRSIRSTIMLGGLAFMAAYSFGGQSVDLIKRTADALERNEADEDDKI